MWRGANQALTPPGKTRPDGALSTGDAAAGNRYDFCTGQSPMSEEQLKAFLEKVKADISLQEKLKAASDANAASAIAKEAGFSISADEFTKAQSTELSDEELEEANENFRAQNLPYAVVRDVSEAAA